MENPKTSDGETLSATKLFGSDINNELIAQVNNAREAAIYMAKVGADGGLGRFVEDALDNSAAHRHWRNAMPPKTPTELAEYQKTTRYVILPRFLRPSTRLVVYSAMPNICFMVAIGTEGTLL